MTCRILDAQALDLPDAAFDRAACSFSLMLFPDRAKGFAELRRVLRPGGRAVVSAWTGPETFEAFGLFLQAARAAFPFIPTPRTPPAVFSLADPDQFQQEMSAAGFRDVRIEIVSREMELPGAEELWALLTAGAPQVQALRHKIGDGGLNKIRRSLDKIVEKRFGAGPVRITNADTIGSGLAG